MPSNLWPRIDQAVGAALERPAAERDAWLAQHLAGEPEALAQARHLIRHADSAEQAFARPPLAAWRLGSGEHIGPWRLVRQLGSGGMGIVWLAERIDGQATMRAAIKLLPPALCGPMQTEGARRRFHAEKEILAQLAHPNIARLLDAGAGSGETPNFVMEYVDGVPLLDYLAHASPTPRREDRLRLFLRICDAVRYAHEKLVVHRDLKPQNILVTAEGEPKLLDFGIARILNDPAGDATVTIHRAYSVDYASPEQLRGSRTGQAIGTATDVYSLGIVLYEMLTGQRARQWNDKTIGEVLAAVENFTLPDAPGLSRDLLAIVRQAAHADETLRYRGVGELVADVERYLAGWPVEARRVRPVERTWRWVRRHWAVASIAATVFSVVSGLALWAERERAATAAKSRELAAALAAERQARQEGQVHAARAEQESAKAIASSKLAAQRQQETEERLRRLLRVFESNLQTAQRDVARLPGGVRAAIGLIERSLQEVEAAGTGGGLELDFLRLRAQAHTLLRELSGGSNSNVGDKAAYDRHARQTAALWTQALALQPTDGTLQRRRLEAQFVLARRGLPRGSPQWSNWEAQFAALLARDPQDPHRHAALANFHFFAFMGAFPVTDARRYPHLDASIRHNQQALQRLPGDAQVLRSLALSHKYRAGSPDPSLTPEQSHAHAQEALRLDRQRAAADPDHAATQLDLAFSISTVGDWQYRIAGPGVAQASYRESFLMRKQLAAGDRDNVFLLGALRYPWVNWALAAHHAGDWDSLRAALSEFPWLADRARPQPDATDLRTVEFWRGELAAQSGDPAACQHFQAALAGPLWKYSRADVERAASAHCAK